MRSRDAKAKSDPNENICWQAATSSQHVLSLSDPRATQRPKWAYSIEHLSYPDEHQSRAVVKPCRGWKHPWRGKARGAFSVGQ